jgi:uncharacterized protein YraI
MKRLFTVTTLLVVLSSVMFPGFGVAPAAAQGDVIWTVEYFNNTTLTGAPAYTGQVNYVGFDWTAQAPVPGVVPDFFSARWTSVQTLAAGSYRINVHADDGVRVFLDGALVINEFHVASGLTYSYTFSVPAGQHVIVVEYYEGDGVAYLGYSLEQLGTVPTPSPTGATATVLAYVLNVRNAPSVATGAILTKINRGQTYPILGRNAAGTWWQINANGTVGWVSGGYVSVTNTQNVPITDGTPAPTTYFITALVNLNIRSGPGLTYAVVGWLPINQQAQVIGRNAANRWWQIQYGSVTGWVSAPYTALQAGADVNLIPITDSGTPVPTTYITTALVNLNIRSGPGLTYAVVGWLPINQQAQVIGRTATNRWWQVRYGGVTGWVSAPYTALQAGADVNLIPVTG